MEHRRRQHQAAPHPAGELRGELALLLRQPDLIFLDEPTAGIDPLLREQLWGEFRRIQREGRTQVVTTQYVGEAEYCDSVILMDQGEIVACDTPDALRRMAAGGELIDVASDDLDRPMLQHLRALPGVLGLALVREDTMRLTVENASALMAHVISAIQERGGTIKAIEERRLTFNEVFIALLARAGRELTEVAREE